jgi:hypothetical protein
MRLYHKIAIAAMAAAFFAISVGAATIPSGIPAGYLGKPFCCDTLMGHYQQIPGVVKLAFFDSGGEGVGFHDADNGHQGDCCLRKLANGTAIAADQPVDMQIFNSYWDWTINNTQEELGSWHISWIVSDPVTGEWQKMSVHVNTAGTYTIDQHAACVDSLNSTSMTFNNAAPIFVNNLPHVLASQIHGGSEIWHIWNLFKDVATVDLDTGLYVLKFQYVQGGWNYDKLIFRLLGSAVSQQPAYRNPTAGSLGLHAIISGDELRLSFKSPGTGEAKISLVNCAGKSVFSSAENSGATGLQCRTVSLRNMRPGVYFVQVEQNGCREVRSFSLTH